MLARIIVPVAVLALSVSHSGCGNEPGEDAPSSAPTPAKAPAGPKRPEDQAKVDAYVEASRIWYDDQLEVIQNAIHNFENNPRFHELVEPWEQELATHQEAGYQPMNFGRSRQVVIDDGLRNEAWSFEAGRIGYLSRGRVIEIIDGNTVIISVRDDPPNPRRRAMVKGPDTSGQAVNDIVDVPTMLEVRGTTTYVNKKGEERTVFLLEPFDIEPWRAEMPPSTLLY